jgi:hypothetical protein
MARNGKRRLAVLGALAAASVVGLLVLVVLAVRDAPGWATAAATSPLAVRCVAIIAAGVVALGVIAALLAGAARARSERRGGVQGIAADQTGTAAIEMTLLLPFAVMIFLVITQAALLFNANMVVHYAAFAASRVSIVVVPMEIGEELRNLVYNPDVELNPPSEKLDLIRRAAVLALVPISASIMDAEAEATAGGGGGPVVEAETRAVFDYLGGADDLWWFRRIRKQYDYANRFVEITLARPDHWRDGDPDPDCPYRHYVRDEWTQWGWSYIPYCPYHDERMDYWYWEDLHLRLLYPYLLEVPIARRVMGGEELEVPGRTGTSWCQWIKVISTLSNEGGPERLPRG